MFASIAYAPFLGLSLLIWGGLLALFLFFLVAIIGMLNSKGIQFLNVKWHQNLAKLALLIAIIHGFLALASRYL